MDEPTMPSEGELYLWGRVWNPYLSGDLGKVLVRLSVRISFTAAGASGAGAFCDDVLKRVDADFEVKAARVEGSRLAISGKVVRALNERNVGMDVEIEGDISAGIARPLSVHVGGSPFTGAALAFCGGSLSFD